MSSTLSTRTKVLPGKRIEFVMPELEEGADVEVHVTPQAANGSDTTQPRQFRDVVEFIDSLPPSNLTMEDWERIEREFHEERNAWGD